MGIRYLNKLIQTKCHRSSSRIHFEQLRDKRIAVDISIYLYRFIAECALLENMYLMASLFRHYNIHAIFVFDGPPPKEKTEVIELRKRKKDAAKQRFYEVDAILRKKKLEPHIDTHEILELEETMTQLKKQFVRIRENDIENVKDLLVSFGFTIVDAEGEADVLCAKLAIKKRVYACMSDDTDMFVYGCPRVLRHISLLNHSTVCYNMSEILSDLSLSQDEFKMMCVVNGTDYDVHSPPHSPPHPIVISAMSTHETQSATDNYLRYRIFQVYELLMEFKRLTSKEKQKYQGSFYEWLETKKKYVSSVIALLTNESMFDISRQVVGSTDQYKQLVILNRTDIQRRRIVELMMKEDFIFIDSKPDDHMILKSLTNGGGTITSSPVYGVGVWDSASTASSSSASVSASVSASASVSSISPPLQHNINEPLTTSVTDQEYKASILANEVYGINASSIHELSKKYSSKPIQIRKKNKH